MQLTDLIRGARFGNLVRETKRSPQHSAELRARVSEAEGTLPIEVAAERDDFFQMF